MHFTELDDYVDGGVLANNPCDHGLTAIQNFHRSRGKKLDIACVVSIGCGIVPAEKLGKTDAHLFLSVGQMFKIDSIKSRVMNLITLLSTAVSLPCHNESLTSLVVSMHWCCWLADNNI